MAKPVIRAQFRCRPIKSASDVRDRISALVFLVLVSWACNVLPLRSGTTRLWAADMWDDVRRLAVIYGLECEEWEKDATV